MIPSSRMSDPTSGSDKPNGTLERSYGMTTRSFARRYGLFAYWLMFALFTLRQAQYPGLMQHPEEWDYPWGAVVAVWALLAVLVAGLHLILRPASFHRSWGRLLAALAYSALLVVFGLRSVITDMPGYYYVPAQFSAVTMVGMLAFSLVQVASALWRRLRRGA